MATGIVWITIAIYIAQITHVDANEVESNIQQRFLENYFGYTSSPAGQWSTWSSWSACSRTCGNSVKQRTRHCSVGHCEGYAYIFASCQVPSCSGTVTQDVNGHWGHWSSLSGCSVTCGIGVRSRHRSCNNPPPSGSGHSCHGVSYQTVSCSTGHTCAVNGAWSKWSEWTSCSTSCDLGTITRQRTCTHPAPSHGGVSCSGDSQETHECSSGPCPTWSSWYNGDCSVSCGDGTQEKLRHCSTGRDSDCTGNPYETAPCHNLICV